MAGRWYILRSGEKFGPYQPRTVRQLLREGRIDPFDRVRREGEEHERPLVEVDEIFVVDGSGSYEFVDREPRLHSSSATTVRMDDVPAVARGEGGAIAEGRRYLELRARGAVGGQTQVGPRGGRGGGEPTLYDVLLGRRVLMAGLPAAEIVRLFERGRLDPAVRVRHPQHRRKVPVDEFVRVFLGRGAGSAPKQAPATSGPAEVAPPRAAGGPPRVYQAGVRRKGYVLNIGHAPPPSPPWLSLAGFLVCVILAVGLFQRLTMNRAARPLDDVTRQFAEALGKMPLDPAIVGSNAPSEVPAAPVVSDAPGGAAGAPRPSSLPKREERPREVARTYVGPSDPARRPQPPVQRRDPGDTTVGGLAGGSTRLSRVADLQGREGQTVTLGPLWFDTSQLNGCSIKCEVRFRDQVGGGLTAIFFRAAYFEALSASGGRSFLRGRVGRKGGSWVLYLTE